jgi:hypothetical protein
VSLRRIYTRRHQLSLVASHHVRTHPGKKRGESLLWLRLGSGADRPLLGSAAANSLAPRARSCEAEDEGNARGEDDASGSSKVASASCPGARTRVDSL